MLLKTTVLSIKWYKRNITFDQHDITSAITILRNEFEADANRHEPFTCISLLLNDNKTISIRWSQDWNDVTALTLYWTAILILQGMLNNLV